MKLNVNVFVYGEVEAWEDIYSVSVFDTDGNERGNNQVFDTLEEVDQYIKDVQKKYNVIEVIR